MTTNYGSASRARQLSRLFTIWKRAFDTQDIRAMTIARRAIDAAVAGKTPQVADTALIKTSLRELCTTPTLRDTR